MYVAPRAGAWIETSSEKVAEGKCLSPPARGATGLKHYRFPPRDLV